MADRHADHPIRARLLALSAEGVDVARLSADELADALGGDVRPAVADYHRRVLIRCGRLSP